MGTQSLSAVAALSVISAFTSIMVLGNLLEVTSDLQREYPVHILVLDFIRKLGQIDLMRKLPYAMVQSDLRTNCHF